MILACPSCATRFAVADEALQRPGGRQVRCANCGHLWHYVPEVVPPFRLEPEVGLAAPSEPTALPPVPRRHGRAAAGIVILVVAIAAAAAIAAFGRREIVALWPPASRLYALTGVHPEPLGAGLEISRIVPTRTPDGLLIAGEIENKSSIPREVPKLRVVLRDAAQKAVQFKTIAPPKPQLQPGEVAHFKTPFAHPNDAATGVVVTFAPS